MSNDNVMPDAVTLANLERSLARMESAVKRLQEQMRADKQQMIDSVLDAIRRNEDGIRTKMVQDLRG